MSSRPGALRPRLVGHGDPVGDGSGLSRENRLSASQLVRVLETSAGRDWWPLAMIWALDNRVAARTAVVVRPTSPDQVADRMAQKLIGR